MTISLMPQSPPFVQFEQRAVEDRNASIAAGGVVFRDVDYVVVMQRGSRDTFEKEATEWLADIDRAVHEGTYPGEWAQHFRRQYEAFREGRETPVIGTHVREWPSLSKAQVETLISARCITVEDLATANEQTLQRIGMGLPTGGDFGLHRLAVGGGMRTFSHSGIRRGAQAGIGTLHLGDGIMK